MLDFPQRKTFPWSSQKLSSMFFSVKKISLNARDIIDF